MNNNLYRLGVGLMLFNEQGRVFAGRRIDNVAEAWQMPQGGVDPEESPINALYREAMEEIGTNNFRILAETSDWLKYDLPPQLQKRLWGGRYLGQRQKWFALLFQGEDKEININQKNPEFLAWRWVEIEELPEIIVEFKKDLYSQIISEFLPVRMKYFGR